MSRLLFREFWKLIYLMWHVVRIPENSHTCRNSSSALASNYMIQCCGSEFSESGSRVLMTKNLRRNTDENFFIYLLWRKKNYKLLIHRPP
jgi:hypothetical protein